MSILKIIESNLNGNFSNPWLGKREEPRKLLKLVLFPYVPINFTKRKLRLVIAPTPAGHLTNVPLVTHKRMWMALVTTSKNHGGNKVTMSTCGTMLKQSVKGLKKSSFFVSSYFSFVSFISS